MRFIPKLIPKLIGNRAIQTVESNIQKLPKLIIKKVRKQNHVNTQNQIKNNIGTDPSISNIAPSLLFRPNISNKGKLPHIGGEAGRGHETTNNGNVNDTEDPFVEGASEAAGVGVTGEGIPLERVKPNVLEEIHPDDKAAYGYSPNEGTRYAESNFTNVKKAQEARKIRQDYLDSSRDLQNNINKMELQGASKEEIARYAVDVRNQQKVFARAEMTPEEVAKLEKGNIERYHDPIGPTPDWIFDKTKASLIKARNYQSDGQVWGEVINKSMKKDDVINTLLGIEH
jgi:hypothetical protein